jgi:hypothetical protein
MQLIAAIDSSVCIVSESTWHKAYFWTLGNISRRTEFDIAAGQPGKVIVKKGVGAVYERRNPLIYSSV